MYRKMLIPLDRSELAEVVFPYAKEIAGRLGLDVILLHVVDEEEKGRVSKYKGYLASKSEALLNQAHYVSRSAGNSRKNGTVRVTNSIAIGNNAEEILNFTEKNNIDLIMMATHGRSGISRWALGSVADKVLRKSRVPVWLIRATQDKVDVSSTWPKMKLLALLDGSKMAESVLPHVEVLAKQKGVKAEITLLRIVNIDRVRTDYPKAEAKLSMKEHIKQRTEHFENEYRQYLADIIQNMSLQDVNLKSEVLVGEPADEIIKYADKHRFDLIVMSTHGRSGMSRWAFGSVADKLIRRVATPIFLVRPRKS